jgi:hypothetical protein
MPASISRQDCDKNRDAQNVVEEDNLTRVPPTNDIANDPQMLVKSHFRSSRRHPGNYVGKAVA